jgi:preprotein translocase subunit SecA
LHQAIEAKEGVAIKEESVTLATVTYQNFFKLYEKFSGMTGTAATEKREFKSTYGLDVVVVPPNKPVIRKDNKDLLFATEKAKNAAIIADIKKNYEIGRPVLVGTFSIKKSETLSALLRKEKIPHQVLNAKHVAEEAAIVAKAGRKHAVTIATNMAGRGTDIKLGYGVAELGGLKVIAAERAENRRIDNQLKGRSGRQGDPGESQFYLSFEDELIKFISEYNEKALNKIDFSQTGEIKQKRFKKIVEDCQVKIEDRSFLSRKDTMKYDKIMNTQRLSFYGQRDALMDMEDCLPVLKNIVLNALKEFYKEDAEKAAEYIELHAFKKKRLDAYDQKTVENYADFLFAKMEKIPVEARSRDIRRIILSCLDKHWVSHLVRMDELKEDVMILSYRGENPLFEYVKAGQALMEDMKKSAHKDIMIKFLAL